jgi:prepilin-type N-terminal cleavage/methylation domain-containing protein
VGGSTLGRGETHRTHGGRPGSLVVGAIRPGFTLYELVTVMVVVAIVAVAVGGPTLAHLAAIRARAAAARIAGDMAFVQRYARSSRLRTWAVFDPNQNRYALYAENPTLPGKANRLRLTHPATQSADDVLLNTGPFAGVSITSVSFGGTDEIEFDSFGLPRDGNSSALSTDGVLTLSSGATLTVRPLTGLVEVSP